MFAGTLWRQQEPVEVVGKPMVLLEPLLGHLSHFPDQPTWTDWPVTGFVPLGGPTFRLLNLASHPLLLPLLLSSLPLSSCSSSSSTLASFLLFPTSPIRHESF